MLRPRNWRARNHQKVKAERQSMSLKWLDTGAQLISRTMELGSQLVFFSPFKKIEVRFPSGSVVKKKKKKTNLHASAEAAGYTNLIPGVRKIPLEEEMATHSSILAWKFPWTEDPGGLQSMGSQIVEQDWLHTHTRTHTEKQKYKEQSFDKWEEMVRLDPPVEWTTWVRRWGVKSRERRHFALAHPEERGALALWSHKTQLYVSSLDKSCLLSSS